MSSHYVYVSCPVEECGKVETIYTGSAILYDFNDCEWEGETIYAKCIDHDGSQDNA